MKIIYITEYNPYMNLLQNWGEVTNMEQAPFSLNTVKVDDEYDSDKINPKSEPDKICLKKDESYCKYRGVIINSKVSLCFCPDHRHCQLVKTDSK